MPFTRLTLDDFELLDYIIEYQSGDLWFRAFDDDQFDTFTTLEAETLTSLGNELMGVGPFSTYLNTEESFTENEQTFVDQQIQVFIEEYGHKVEFTSRMPLSDLTLSQFIRIEDIKEFLIFDLWERKFVDDETLSEELNSIVDQFGEQLFGTKQLYSAYASTEEDFGQEVQDKVDSSFRAFINRY